MLIPAIVLGEIKKLSPQAGDIIVINMSWPAPEVVMDDLAVYAKSIGIHIVISTTTITLFELSKLPTHELHSLGLKRI